jgi:thiamine kinase-like enzyme
MKSTDSKSGARFERVVIGDASFVLKHVDTASDWIMRQTGDVGLCPVITWERGVVDLAPPCIDHATVGAAREGRVGAVLMRDVSASMVPSGDARLPLEQHLRFVEHLATFHASCWDWDDTVGLIPLANRYTFFGPQALACERQLGFPAAVPRIAAEGWQRLASVAPDMARTLDHLHAEPWALLAAIAATPRTFLHGDWKLGNLGTDPDGRTVLVDWSMCGAGPPLAELAHYLALNVARFPAGHTKEDAIAAYRTALARTGVATDAWFDRQLRLCLLGVMLQLGWEKAFDETGVELAWWDARVREGIDELGAA